MISREGRKTSSDKERAGGFLFESFVTDFAESFLAKEDELACLRFFCLCYIAEICESGIRSSR